MLEKLKAKVNKESVKGFLREHGPFLVIALLMAAFLLSGVGLANTTQNPADKAFENATKAICNIVKALQGPIGLGIVILMFAIGGVSLAIGGRNAMPLMIGAAIGGIIVAAAPFFGKIFLSLNNTTNLPTECSGVLN